MKLRVVWIGPKSRSKEACYDTLTREYVGRISKYQQIEASDVASEAALLQLLERSGRRTTPMLVVLDARGSELSSEEFAAFIEAQQSRDVQQLIFAVGPANGFSETIRHMAAKMLSLGKMTLPHELARIVMLEQIYRAFTIIKRHPYHCGH